MIVYVLSVDGKVKGVYDEYLKAVSESEKYDFDDFYIEIEEFTVI